MDSLLIILLVVLIGISLVILYFQLKVKPKQEEDISDKIKEDIKLVGKVEMNPKFDGKQMIMVIQPL